MFHENLSDKDKVCFMKLKKTLIVLFIVFFAVLVLFFAVKIINEIKNGKYIGQDVAQMNTINVSGEGEVFAKPDIAQISFSVEKEAASVVSAQNQATEAINKIVSFLKNSGIEEKDIKTTNYNIYPRYDWLEKEGRVFRGYIVSQSLEVKIRKIEKAGDVLAGAAEAGASMVGGISFAIDDEKIIRREVRQKAIIDAREKAEQLARDLGVTLVRLVSFSESSSGMPMPMMMKSAEMGIGGGVAPEIPSGENNIITNVNLVYEIR